jgi:hypothetical protein
MRAAWSGQTGWGITVVGVALAIVTIHAGWLKFFKWA